MSSPMANKSQLPEYAFMRYFEDGYVNWPSKQALIGTGEAYTYAEAYLRSKVLAWYLESQLHIGPDSTVAMSSANYIDLPVITAAVQACGAMLVMCSGRAEPHEYLRYASRVNPDLFIVNNPAACPVLAG